MTDDNQNPNAPRIEPTSPEFSSLQDSQRLEKLEKQVSKYQARYAQEVREHLRTSALCIQCKDQLQVEVKSHLATIEKCRAYRRRQTRQTLIGIVLGAIAGILATFTFVSLRQPAQPQPIVSLLPST
jgi:tetrahydromethanopterin S-methyltransferase subunit G